MASPPVVTPGGTTGHNVSKYSREIRGGTYQYLVAIPKFDDEEKPNTSLIIRKFARVLSTATASTFEGDVLTASNPVATPVTLSAAGNYIYIQWSANQRAQLDQDFSPPMRAQLNLAMAEGSDQILLANVASFTQIMSQASVDGPSFRQALARVAANTNGVTIPGGGGPKTFCIFSVTQMSNFGNIPEYNNAQVRGDSQNPYVTGVILQGSGAQLDFSTVIAQDGNGWHNFIGISEAMAVAWNEHTQIDEQQLLLQMRLVAFNNFASGVVHDLRGLDYRTTSSGL
jgi:hypothetical protein